MYFCCGSFENAISQTEPAAFVFFATNISLTYVPSERKTWIRSLTRSHTYTKPSLDGSAQCTGLRNCFAGGADGSYGPRSVSSGLAPYAPQKRFILPVFWSSTATRWLK